MTLQHKRLGSTDLMVSVIGLGTVKLGRNTDVKYPDSFTIPDDAQAANLLSLAQDLNINLLDTAPAYGNSEERLGHLLRGQRDRWVIVGKAGEEYDHQQSTYNFTRQHIMQSIKRSLQRLRTDYIDLLLIHSDGNDEHIINNFDVFNTLDDAKQQGLIRYSGMSTKTVTGGLLTLQHSDVAMVTHNPSYTEELPVIEQAAKSHKGILIKKGFASGHLNKLGEQNPVQAAMDFILAEPGISSIIVGTINPKHLSENAACATQALKK
ncbi:MAG TPA: aldo/keto reductase [Gammaproteobacteria bacterium]|nr:aldo/keto reductase [Gammaproteobacteria bacterium]